MNWREQAFLVSEGLTNICTAAQGTGKGALNLFIKHWIILLVFMEGLPGLWMWALPT